MTVIQFVVTCELIRERLYLLLITDLEKGNVSVTAYIELSFYIGSGDVLKLCIVVLNY